MVRPVHVGSEARCATAMTLANMCSQLLSLLFVSLGMAWPIVVQSIIRLHTVACLLVISNIAWSFLREHSKSQAGSFNMVTDNHLDCSMACRLEARAWPPRLHNYIPRKHFSEVMLLQAMLILPHYTDIRFLPLRCCFPSQMLDFAPIH